MWMAWRSASGDNGIHEIYDNCYAYEKSRTLRVWKCLTGLFYEMRNEKSRAEQHLLAFLLESPFSTSLILMFLQLPFLTVAS